MLTEAILVYDADTFRSLCEVNQYLAIRLFVSRDYDGSVRAECRINGEYFPEWNKPLIEYAKTWPKSGLEWRKQLLVIQRVRTH
jgi:hypothetical protein